jgi:SUF system NifU family Fe-S assembly protein
MDSFDLKNLYRQVIMDHYKDPINKGILEDDTYHKVHLKNPTCGDDITIAVKLNGEIIEDIRHDGIGCSICCSSASVLCDVLSGKRKQETLTITNNFYDMIKGEKYDEKLDMGDAVAYIGVSQFPARIKCATIPWKAFEATLKEMEEK